MINYGSIYSQFYVCKGNWMEIESALKEIRMVLKSHITELTAAFESIYKMGIPDEADKIVIWIPLGSRYNLSFTYMTNDANEIYKPGMDFGELSVLDQLLEDLIDNYMDSEFYKDISRATDIEVASWLYTALESSSFKGVSLHKAMAINNVCAYFDLKTLTLIDDSDMWPEY